MAEEQRSWIARFFSGKGASSEKTRVAPLGTAPVVGITPSGEWKEGDVLLNNYRVGKVLGKGGMGKVYLVHSLQGGERFAVKKTLLRQEEARRNFLAELQTWLDLPGHPHTVPCHFFRTMGDEVVIFSEYVEGGSLKDWIDDERLYRGGTKEALKRILDISIQFAWGLHALHELEMVHQDVKPANLLITSEGIAKVSDFGLVRARAKAGEKPTSEDGKESILVSCGGMMTRAYCSPEQAAGNPLTRRTDTWSWGVSVLEMFTGGVTWGSGIVAPEALEGYLKSGRDEDFLPVMPPEVAEVLRRCFRHDPADRWSSLLEAAERLKGIYSRYVGCPYSRPTPSFVKASERAFVEHDRRTAGGVKWDDPKGWLTSALQEAGRDPGEAEKILSAPAGSRQVQSVSDLRVYEEAVGIYQMLVASGRKDLEEVLARVCLHKAFVHVYLNDLPGSLGLYDKATEIQEQLVHKEGRWELANNLATSYSSKANTLGSLGRHVEAAKIYDKTIEIWERLVHKEGRWELANDLAGSYNNKATALYRLGMYEEVLKGYDKAIEIWERLVHKEGRWELANDLALSYNNKALTLDSIGRFAEAARIHDKAIVIRERLVHKEGRWELANDLALSYNNKANALHSLERFEEAIKTYDKAIEIYERLIHKEGRWELANDLALSYSNKAGTLDSIGRSEEAARICDKAIEIYERLVHKEGRWELANDLAGSYNNKANALSSLGRHEEAARIVDKAIEIFERLVHKDGRWELANNLATSYSNKALKLDNLGRSEEAARICDKAIKMLEEGIKRTGRKDLRDRLNKFNEARDILRKRK